MRTHYPPAEGLRECIIAVLEGAPTPAQVSTLVRLSHAIAVVFFRRRVSAAALDHWLPLHSYSDLAYDCIGDLFHPDAAGSLPQFKRHFALLDCRSASDEALLAHLHRLVFSNAQQGLVRIYGEADPSLARVLRRIRATLRTLALFRIRERFGEHYLIPIFCDSQEHLPEIDRDQVHAALCSAGAGARGIPALLERLWFILKEDRTHSRMVPLLTVALALRSLYAENGSAAEDEHHEPSFVLTDGLGIIRQACREIHQNMRVQYVGRKGVRPDLYENYGRVVEAAVAARLTGGDGEADSLFELLSKEVAGLTRETYAAEHRSRLEYLARLAERLSLDRLRKNF